jgi:hypothetical protein
MIPSRQRAFVRDKNPKSRRRRKSKWTPSEVYMIPSRQRAFVRALYDSK